MAFKRHQDGYESTKSVDDGVGGKTTAYHIGNGMYISKVKFKWSIKENGYVADFRDKREKTPDATPAQNDKVADQPQIPENPGIRKEAYSTYGISIPISIGRRVITGNIVDATDLTPVLIGAKTTITEFTVPIYSRDVGPE